jgi:hypothetical protein
MALRAPRRFFFRLLVGGVEASLSARRKRRSTAPSTSPGRCRTMRSGSTTPGSPSNLLRIDAVARPHFSGSMRATSPARTGKRMVVESDASWFYQRVIELAPTSTARGRSVS